jgi:hypothetical protein
VAAIATAAFAGMSVCLLLAAGPAAAADSCPSEESVLPFQGNDPAFQCAQMEKSGKKSLNPWQSKTWSKSVSMSPYGYEAKATCQHPNNSAVTVVSYTGLSYYSATGTNWGTSDHSFGAGVLFTGLPPSTSPPFTNGGVDSGSYEKGSCNKHGEIKTSIRQLTQSLTFNAGTYERATVNKEQTIVAPISPTGALGDCALQMNPDGTPYRDPVTNKPVLLPGHGCVLLFLDNKNPNPEKDTVIGQGPISGGKAYIKWTPQAGQEGDHKLTAMYLGDTTLCPSYNATCGYAPFITDQYVTSVAAAATATAASFRARLVPGALSVPLGDDADVSPVAGAASPPDLRVVTRERTRTMPARLELSCPAQHVLMNAETLTGARAGDVPVAHTRRGARVRSEQVSGKPRVSLQITCRARSARPLVARRVGFGTLRADEMATGRRAGAHAFGGPGTDRIRVRAVEGLGNGGLGDDTIIVAGRDGVATGGPGNDRLIARTHRRVLLIGGPGHDVLIGSRGATVINAQDGERDRVVCRSARNRVLADRADRLQGCRSSQVRFAFS